MVHRIHLGGNQKEENEKENEKSTQAHCAWLDVMGYNVRCPCVFMF